MIELVNFEGRIHAIILRASYEKDGIEFFTPCDFSQQLGFMKRPKGHIIPAHVHNEVNREITLTNEVLFVKQGRIRVDFFGESNKILDHRTLITGDVILLAAGGHGIEFIEESQLIEVKQGPYAGDQDKTRI